MESGIIRTKRIAFVGGGHMATALIGGLRAAGVAGESIVVADPVAGQLERLRRDFGVHGTPDGAAAARDADVVVLAVKPQEMAQAARALGGTLAERRRLVISVAAGIRIEDLARWLGAAAAIVRAMPNRPALIGAGVSAMVGGADLSAEERSTAEQVLGACGATVWLESESQIDAVTAVSGSGPAYFFLLMEALESAGVALGLAPDTARRLAVETARGAGRMAVESGTPPSELRAQVTSKGGTTAAALEVLESAGVRAIFADAVAAAARRSAELAREFGAQ